MVAVAVNPAEVGVYNRKTPYRLAVADLELDRGVGAICFAPGTDSKAFQKLRDAEDWFEVKNGYRPDRFAWG